MNQEKRTGNLPEKIESFVAEKSKKKQSVLGGLLRGYG
jgi:hypothetical protein